MHFLGGNESPAHIKARGHFGDRFQAVGLDVVDATRELLQAAS